MYQEGPRKVALLSQPANGVAVNPHFGVVQGGSGWLPVSS